MLMAVFLKGGFTISKQAVSLWARTDTLPARRELQLRRLRPWWFRDRKVNGMAMRRSTPAKVEKPKSPKLRKKRPANLAEAEKIKGPPFRGRSPSETEL